MCLYRSIEGCREPHFIYSHQEVHFIRDDGTPPMMSQLLVLFFVCALLLRRVQHTHHAHTRLDA